MKQLIAILLVGTMLASLVACAGRTTPDSSMGTPAETGQSADGVADEINRAISHGLVPEEIQGDYGTVITFQQYCQMLTNLICIWDETRLGE